MDFFVLRLGNPAKVAVELSRNATAAVTDAGYTRIQRQWRQLAACDMDCPLIEVETDVVVPVEITSDHEAYSAATIRRRLARQLPRFLRKYASKYADMPLVTTRSRTSSPS